MYGDICKRKTWMLVALIMCLGPMVVGAVEHPSHFYVNNPGYSTPAMSEPAASGGTATQIVPTSAINTYVPQDDLAARVAELESQLGKINTKAAADKKKQAGAPSVKVGGRIQADWAMFDQSESNRGIYGDWGDRCEFRRARIFVKGDAFHVIDYKFQMDFADNPSVYTGSNQSTSFKDVYITLKELPLLGHVRIGHYKEPFGLDQLTSAKYITFMERSLCDENTIIPGRNTGIMVFDHSENERLTWAIGAFKSVMGAEPPIRKNEYEGGTALTMRGTILPWYDEGSGGRGLVHIGGAYSYRDLDDDEIRLKMTPESHLGETILDTGNIAADYWQIAGGELAFVYGPFSIQSECFGGWVHPEGGGSDIQFNGCYVYVSYFLTGEHRRYKLSNGVFDRIKPHENFFRVRDENGYVQMGKGAWEIAYRYSTLDLMDGPVANRGGLARDHTLGLNWYLNPYTRVMWNYVNSNIPYSDDTGNPAGGTVNVFEMRAQIDF